MTRIIFNHKRFGPWALAGVLALGGAGCSMQKLAVRSMVPLMDAALIEAYASGDVQTVRDAIPGQLLLLRGVCRSDPGRLETWTLTTQLYAVYALIFIEDEDPERAARLYAEGRDVGLRFLRRTDWFREGWEAGPDALRAQIAAHRPQELAPIMTWTAACLGKHVLNHLDRPREIADLPYAYVLGDAAIALAPDYSFGMPYVLKAVTLCLTPPMLGGDLEEADRLFRQAFDLTERRFLFHQVLYAHYYCTAALDEELYDRTLREVLDAPEDLLPEARLVNLIAREHAQRLLEQKEDLF